MIKTTRGRLAGALMEGRKPRQLQPDLFSRANRKLAQLDAAVSLDDLRVPPSNRLEKLAGSRKHQHSIRINQQWRICFEWRDGDVFEVEITDYH